MERLYDRLSRPQGVFARAVTPSLFIGTRGLVSSAAAYALGDGGSGRHVKRVQEVMTMGADGALIVLDWEIPIPDDSDNDNDTSNSNSNTDDITRANSIDRPVVLLLHGLNNDSSFGYVRSMMRMASARGFISVCMNLRGQDGAGKVRNTTPRGYTAGYTGNLRGVVRQLERRLKRTGGAARGRAVPAGADLYVGGPLFLVGYSLGANLITKYLGKEALHGTLPGCIGGGAALGNPLHIHSGSVPFPWNVLLGAGVKRSLLQVSHGNLTPK
jgi:predicted alpha/beta-fold hydrolase